MRPKGGVLIHHVGERLLDQIRERQRAAELAVTLHTLVHVASDLDTQVREFLRGFEL